MVQTGNLQMNQLYNQQGCLLSAGGIAVFMYMQVMSPDTATPAPHKAPTATTLSGATLQPETYSSFGGSQSARTGLSNSTSHR